MKLLKIALVVLVFLANKRDRSTLTGLEAVLSADNAIALIFLWGFSQRTLPISLLEAEENEVPETELLDS